MNQRKVFVIRGSEDGNIEVVSNMSKAYDRCFKYVDFDGESHFGSQESKGSFMKSLSRSHDATLTRNNSWEVTATAERFYLE